MDLNKFKKEELISLVRYIEQRLKSYEEFKEKKEKEGTDQYTVYQYLGYSESSIRNTLEAIEDPTKVYIINEKIYEENNEYKK